MKKIVAFTGKMGVGKSEAIATLKNYAETLGLEADVTNVKFAQPLYDIQSFVYERINRDVPQPKDRKLLQWLGTDWGRSVDQNLWVNLWKAEVARTFEDYEFQTENVLVTCDDCRFDNEAEVIKSLGGVIIHITSDRNGERIDTKAGIANHASEAGINPQFVDFIVENNGSIQSYRDALTQVFRKITQSG